MTVSIAGLGHPFLRLLALFSTKSDIRSILCFFSFCIVILVLAYLTNPSESSFRAYLTELSFRQHLSRLERLDDGVDDVPFPDVSASHPTYNQSLENPPLLHFGARASVSIRTPKHVFHSFAVFTVATMLPAAKSSQRNNSSMSSIITDSWYIGAFGKWWRGGIIEAWYQDVVARSNDEESWTSGILSLTTIDVRHDSSGLPLSSCGIAISQPSRSSPPKLRNRERSSQQTNLLPRCSTPPHLPKSASLPLHASRPEINCIDRAPSSHPSQSQAKSGFSFEQINLLAIPQASSDCPSPIAELLRQISIAKAAVLDLRTQLSECQNLSSQSHAHLQDKVDTYRERKRREDVIKIELRSRTKSLDDSKRQAEGLKREAEKKLKAVQNIRGNTTHRVVHLDEKVIQLQDQIACDRGIIDQRSIQQSATIRALSDEIELRKREVKTTEEQMVFSSQSVKELESKLNKERERLEMLKHRLGARKEVMDDQRVRSWSDPSIPSSNILDPVHAVSVQRDHLGSLESSDLREARSAGIDNASIVESDQSPTSSHSQETTLLDAFSKYVSYLADRSPSFSFPSDTNPPREVARTYLPTHPSSTLLDHVSQNASYPTEIPAHYGQNTITINPPAEDELNVEREFHCSRVGTFPNLSQVEWDAQPEYAGTSLDSEGIIEHSWPPFDIDGSPKKRLNPDAKEFSLASTTSTYSAISPPGVSPMYETLNSHGFQTDECSTATYNPSFLRAFAPSPAERQVLQRALGGASNTSLERLPSLGDVGTIPISSSSIGTPKDLPILNRALPSWLLVPQNHKVNFSPWDDEEQDQHR